MARRVLAYECQYCGAIKKSKNIATRHEESCKQNPNARNCMFCVHHTKLEECVPGGGRLWCPLRSMACSSAVGAKCPHFKRTEEVKDNG